MLLEVNIKNFAIIDDVSVKFTNGLNIMTGETGSGKSILVDAIGIILGSRSSKNLIQDGCKKAVLQGVFYLEDISSISNILNEYSISVDSDNLIIITKEINSEGPSLSKINGRNITLSMLKNITSKLVDIFGQHEHQSLIDSSNHQSLVDSFGDSELFQLKSDIKSNYKDLLNEKDKFEDIFMDSSERNREIDLLKFQIEEIEEAKLYDEDEDSINQEFNKLSNINRILSSVNEVISYMKEDFENLNTLGLLNKSLAIMGNISKYDDNLQVLNNKLKNIKFESDDFLSELEEYGDSILIDDERIIYLNSRIELIHKLKRKYGTTIQEILDFQKDSQKRLNVLSDYEKQILNVKQKISKLESMLEESSEKLSFKRKEISRSIEENIKKQLEELNMNRVDFKIDFSEKKRFTNEGYDKIEFLISTNPGENLKSLSKIASGGEMSRIMLAFKSTLAFFDKIPTMIFDEIDTGISGRTAQVVGEKILEISKNHQIICISHLPQIAALADTHFLIDKIYRNNKTRTSIKKLSYEQRIEEMARILSGVDLTDTTLKHAKEMIEMSKGIKSLNKV